MYKRATVTLKPSGQTSSSLHGIYAVLLSQWLGSFCWVLLLCWPVTVNVAQYTAILHYINLQTKVGISSFSLYSCECYWVWFSCLLTTQSWCMKYTRVSVPLIHPRNIVQIYIYIYIYIYICTKRRNEIFFYSVSCWILSLNLFFNSKIHKVLIVLAFYISMQQRWASKLSEMKELPYN